MQFLLWCSKETNCQHLSPQLSVQLFDVLRNKSIRSKKMWTLKRPIRANFKKNNNKIYFYLKKLHKSSCYNDKSFRLLFQF